MISKRDWIMLYYLNLLGTYFSPSMAALSLFQSELAHIDYMYNHGITVGSSEKLCCVVHSSL